jgi:RNA polymerase sigma-70 factor (sigma-E family)
VTSLIDGRVGVPSQPVNATVDVVALYAAHRLALVRLAVLLVDDLPLAEDLVQDAFLGLHRRHAALTDPAAALGYLRSSVVNGSRSALRRRRTVRAHARRLQPVPEDVSPADHDVLRAADQDEVLRAVRALPPRQREVLVLRYWSELTERQIAAALGISEGSVKSTASRGLDRLERLLAGPDDHEGSTR